MVGDYLNTDVSGIQMVSIHIHTVFKMVAILFVFWMELAAILFGFQMVARNPNKMDAIMSFLCHTTLDF